MNNYFPHDSNARNSDKLIPLRARLGAEGYGIYFMLIERLREESSYMSVKDYNMLAFDFRVDAGIVKSVIEDFGLFAFTDDGKCFYSESLLRRMKIKDDKSEKARQSAKSRWSKKGKAANAEEIPCERNANAEEIDAIKEKESKKNNNPSIIPPDGQGGGDAQSAEWGEEFLKTFLEATPADSLDRRLRTLEISKERFIDIARAVIREWNDEGVRHQKFDGAARHLFNHVRKKLRLDPRLRTAPTAAELKRAEARRAEEQQRAEEEARLYRQSVQQTGRNGWQQYCDSHGLDPDKTNARKLAEQQAAPDPPTP